MEPSNIFVCLMGMGTVFISLICIILLCQLMSFLCQKLEHTKSSSPPILPTAVAPDSIPNRQEFVAAVSCAIAEDLDEAVSGIRILSIKKL
ncbi:MAG: OadG family protein [Niameybacter sp.]